MKEVEIVLAKVTIFVSVWTFLSALLWALVRAVHILPLPITCSIVGLGLAIFLWGRK